MKTKYKILVSAVVLISALPFLIIGWIAIGYAVYGHEARLQCADFEWWEDYANCAAEIALEKNDPRYCRISVVSEVSDVCMLIYAEQTFDGTTCRKIDNSEAKQNCQARFEAQ